LERANWQPSKSDVGLSPSGDTAFYPSSSTALRRYHTTPGDELRTMSLLLTREEVLAASLNYSGKGADRRPVTSDFALDWLESAVWFLGEKKDGSPIFEGGTCKLAELKLNSSVPVVLDGDKEHARRVVYQLRKAYRAGTEKSLQGPVTLTTLTLGSSTDLYMYCLLLLAAGELKDRISVLNLSVDLGILCQGLSTVGTPIAAELYSFPLFETCLDTFLASRLKLGHDVPVVAAAAGNKLQDKVRRWRFGFPASLPDVAAVTCAAEPNGLSSEADWPAVGPLKPCFAASPREFPKSRFRYELDLLTTSYASGAFAGWVAAIDAELDWKHRGPFGKLAALTVLSDVKRIRDSDPPSWAPVDIRRVGFAESESGGSEPGFFHQRLSSLKSESAGSEPGFFRKLLHKLLAESGREFVLTGSAAFVEQWVERRPDISVNANKILELIGDLDLFYTGESLDKVGQVQMDRAIRRWLAAQGDSAARPWPGEITAHPIRNWAGALYLFQCVIPGAHLLATAGGIIDPWEALPTCDGHPPIYIPPADVWAQNPQLRGGECGLADGIMVYVNRLVVEARLRQLPPRARVRGHAASTGTDEKSDLPIWLGKGARIIRVLKEKVEKRVGTGLSNEDWFGRGCTGPSKRLKRRLEHVELLTKLLEGDDRYQSFLQSVRNILKSEGKISGRIRD
jgi:hypothetical protein